MNELIDRRRLTAAPWTVSEAHVRRGEDLPHGRRPLRLSIARRRARTRAGAEKFVTQVRFGDSTAVVVPWREGRSGGRGELSAAPAGGASVV
jgi:hypothetical protein